MLEISKSTNNIGATFSSVNPNIYNQFKKDQDGEVFEKVVFDLMLNKYSDDPELSDYILSLPNDKQRMALLSLIDGDTALWSKMNSYVNDCSDKFEHIKDVIKIMSKFVKDGEVEKREFGEVMTPISLVREILDNLPKEVWSNPDLKWLDPANGAGTFPYVVIYKLMNGLSEWQPDIELRYKHIVENMIYTCELQSRNVFLWLCGVDPKDEYTTNSYWGSFLDNEFDYHMKSVWCVEKFDIVIGNPPYQKGKDSNFYVKFIDKFFNISKKDAYLSYIVPNRFFQPSHKAHKSIMDYDIKKVYHNLNDYFPNVSTHIGGFLLNNNKSVTKNESVVCVFNDNTVEIDFNTPVPTDINMSSIVYKNLLDKIIKNKKLTFTKDRSDLYIKRQWKRWNSITEIGGDHVFNCILIYNEETDGKDGKWIKCDDIKKMEWYLSKSNVIRFITKLFASAMNVPPFIWSIIPDVDLSKINNNQDLYNFFELNDFDIKLIEKTIK
jgi:hypothetical protein